MYAIVRTGGKQYRVEEGRSLKIDRLSAEEGDTVELGDVLLIANNGDVTVGSPAIEGARVLATVEEQGRAKKIIVFKYKSKVRTRKKTGHRQRFTKLSVVEILAPGQRPKKEKPARRKPAARAEEPEAAVTEEPVAEAPAAEAPVAEPAAVEKPKRRIIRRPKAGEPKAAKEKAPKAAKKEPAEDKPKRTRKKKTEDKE